MSADERTGKESGLSAADFQQGGPERAAKFTPRLTKFRGWFAASLGVGPERKAEIYLELSRSASLGDTAYWLQILFAAGVATFGLTLNSPAVIIGAMLISPLMGPILAAGLALAAGDLVLGLRAAAVLALSCLAAVAFSVLLVGLLPFREMTGEIAARTQPNTLDLFVALFSGAIGSIAISKEVKGVVTSIPGVAIAVALMPPLCVVGYGVGVALSHDAAEGLRVAGGGGLLFLTNLVAITFTAMVVFLALHVDTREVRERVREWRRGHGESRWVRAALARYRISEKAGNIGGAYARLLVIVVPMALLAIPLTRSLNHLKREINRQRQENQARRAAADVWQQSFARLPNGEARSHIDQLTLSELGGKLTAYLRVFTSRPYTGEERAEWVRRVAARLNRPADTVSLQLIEIPTASGELATIARAEPRVAAPPTVAQLRASFWQGVEAALRDLRLPPSVQVVSYRLVTSAAEPGQVVLNYFCDHELAADTQALITEEVRARFADPTVAVSFARVPTSFGPLTFGRNQSALPASGAALLDEAGRTLSAHPGLRAEVVTAAERGEREGVAAERAQAVGGYLTEKWRVSPDRVRAVAGAEAARTAHLKLTTAASPAALPASLSRLSQAPAAPNGSPAPKP
jgi:uncharacterized hydrophobic protein (TIGR00271 family)